MVKFLPCMLNSVLFIIVPISMAVAVENFESADENYLSFKKGDVLYIYSKYVERDNSIWQGSLV